MKHYGDITKLKGDELPIVDIITGGSPCQDLSVAGKRKGLAGERSGLFTEQIRVIKELREHDRRTNLGTNDSPRLVRPRFMVWENVPGVFTSNDGEDFRVVLEETARVAERDAVIPRPAGGVWSVSGAIVGRYGSIAWRLHDSQFWGVAQRRKRVVLVADIGGTTAPSLLFERESVSGDTPKIGEQRETAPAGTERGARSADRGGIVFRKTTHAHNPEEGQGYEATEISDTLNTLDYSQNLTPILVVDGEAVRRLTPLEFERLQGYPDGWTDIKDWTDSQGKVHKDSDSPRYKALGNSIALPFFEWLAERIAAQYNRPATMASLFDGIGGFPLVFSRAGVTPVWASEIEEFPIAVTKIRFPEE